MSSDDELGGELMSLGRETRTAGGTVKWFECAGCKRSEQYISKHRSDTIPSHCSGCQKKDPRADAEVVVQSGAPKRKQPTEPDRARKSQKVVLRMSTDLLKYVEDINQHRPASDKAELLFDKDGKFVIKGINLQVRDEELKESKTRYTALQGSHEVLVQEKNLADEQVKQLQVSLNEVDESLKKAEAKIEEYRKREKLREDFTNKINASKQAWESTNPAEELDG
jgi:hypothetical protein